MENFAQVMGEGRRDEEFRPSNGRKKTSIANFAKRLHEKEINFQENNSSRFFQSYRQTMGDLWSRR